MDEIKNIVHSVIGDLSGQQLKNEQQLFEFWDRILNSKERKHARLSGLKNGTLYVHVDSSAWLYQMNLQKGKILRRMQEKFPEVRKIFIKIGSKR